MPLASEIEPSVLTVIGTKAAIQTLASNTLGQNSFIVLYPALSGICAGSLVQKNCSSV